jgi:hypothetical protein
MTSRPTLILWAALGGVLSIGFPVSVAAAESRDQPAASPVEAERPDEALALARKIVAKAKGFFDAGHYAAALAEYTRAYDVLDRHPRQYWVLHNLAVCHERLFHYDLALKLYEDYLRRAPQTESDRGEVAAVIRTLRALLGTVAVETAVAAEVWVDERRLGTAPGSWFVAAGRHTVEVRAAGYEAERLEIQIAARQTRVLRPKLRQLSSITGPSPAYFWIAAGAGAASAVAGATFGILALGSQNEGLERSEMHLDTSEQSERTRKQALAADACFGGALLFGAAATVLYFVTDWSDREAGQSSRRARPLRTVASVSVEPRRRLGLSVSLEF